MTFRITRLLAALAVAALILPVAAGATTGGQTVHLDGVRTTLTTDPATTGVIISHGVLPLPVGSATVVPRFGPAGPSLSYAFPITGGRVDAATLAGVISHFGGLRFVNLGNGHTLTLTRFRIRISDHPGLTAEVNGNRSVRVRILKLDLIHASVAENPPAVTVANVRATLTRTAALALNNALGVSFFSKGIVLGTARVNAHIG